MLRGDDMYTKEKLLKYPYFQKVLQERDLSTITDSLTGLLARPYIIGFIHSLVEENVSFTLGMLDLDNFKFINDTYGHKVGDGVLSGVSSDLMRYLDDYGIAGRIGGDEFLIVNLRDKTYADVKSFYFNMYANFNVLRKNIALESCDPFITGTIGSATFPYDASDYDSLFELIDKTMYRGKTKGRNCYIIYVESKHKNIVIKEIASRGIFTIQDDLTKRFDSKDNLYDKLDAVIDIMREDLRISDFYYINCNNEIKSVALGEVVGTLDCIGDMQFENAFMTNESTDISKLSPCMHRLCEENNIKAFILARIGIGKETYGYLLCGEPEARRLWQEDECAIMFFLARLIASYLKLSGEELI